VDDYNKFEKQLVGQLNELRQRIVEYKTLDSQHIRLTQKALQESNRLFQRVAEAASALQSEIDKRLQVEEELEKERRRLFSVLDCLPAHVYLLGPDYLFRFSNRFFREEFGEPGSKPCYEVFSGRTEPCEQCGVFIHGKSIEVNQVEWSNPDGRTYLVYDYPFSDVDGTQLLLAFGFDVTEQKQMQEELILSEERFSKAFMASPYAMAINTLEEGEFIDVNDSFCGLVNTNRKETLGKTSLELGYWLDRQDVSRIRHKIINNEPIREMEVYFRRSTGEERLGLYTGERFDTKGEPCILSIMTDITHRREMEVEMIRLERLGLVGEMSASIAHEIRNPMTTVRGFLQILKEDEKYINESEYFELMIEELDRANSIITDFLSLAKNKMVELRAVNIKSILVNMMPLLQATAVVNGQYIRLEAEEVPNLLLDEKEIRQLVLNLFNNALEAMPEGRAVIIRTYTKDGNVILAVQDEGWGIDTELLEKLGTPFFTTKDQGTGLGLAVCFGIAARHQAKIEIETSPLGTTFFVRFPIT